MASIFVNAINAVAKQLAKMSIQGQRGKGITQIPNALELQKKASEIVFEMREKGYDLVKDMSPANIKLFLNNKFNTPKQFRSQEGVGSLMKKKYPPHEQRNELGFMQKSYPDGVQPGSVAAKAIDESEMYKASKKTGKFDDVFENMFGGFKPEVVPKSLSPEAIKRIKGGISTKIKLNRGSENKRYAKELMTNSDEFRQLPDADRKELLDLIEESIKDTGEDVFPFNTGGRVGFKGGKGVASLEEEYYGSQKLDWLKNFSDQMTFEEYLQMISMKAAKGGRVGLKGGGVGHPPSSNSMFENLFYNTNHPYLSTFNTMGIMDMIQQIPGLFNEGGRVGFKKGKGLTRRTFLKLMGGLGALPFVGKFLGPAAKVAEKAAPAAVEGFKIGKDKFLMLVDKIKRFGDPAPKSKYQDLQEVTRYTDKKGNTYELYEDLATGNKRITRDKPGVGSYGDKTFDTIEDRTTMELRKGEYVKGKKGKQIKTKDEYIEEKEVANVDGVFDDAMEVSDDVAEEIIEEVGGAVIKKKSGGLATMFKKK